MTKRIQRTAYHEAGHAVACIAKGRKFKYVTISPKDGSRGHIRYNRVPSLEFAKSRALIDRGIITLAGTCAEKIKFGRYSHGFGHDDGESDRSHAADLFLSADIADARPYYAKTEALLRKHWAKVEAVAGALLTHKTLSYQVVAEFCKLSRPFKIYESVSDNGVHF